MEKNKKGLILLITGIALFVLRYVPLISQKGLLGKTTWYTLREYASGCNSFLGSFVQRCSWVEPLNWIMIALAIILVVYGAYSLYKKN